MIAVSEKWKLVLPLKAPLMTPNSQRRAHWTEVRRCKAEHELIVSAAAGRMKPITEPVVVTVIWYAPDLRTRDSDSLDTLKKAALDALVKKGILKDDSFRYVRQTRCGPIIVARDNPRIEIIVEKVVEDMAE